MFERMRLREVLEAIETALPHLEPQVAGETLPQGVGGFALSNHREVRAALAQVAELSLGSEIKTLTEKARQHQALAMPGDRVLLDQRSHDSLRDVLASLRGLLKPVQSALKALFDAERPGQFALRIPHRDGTTFDEMAKDLADVSKAIEQPLRRLLDTHVYVVGVDRGSIILEAFAVLGGAVGLINAIFSAAERWQRGSARRAMDLERLKQMKIKTEVADAQAQVDKAVAARTLDMLTQRVVNVSERIRRNDPVDIRAEIVDAELVDDEALTEDPVDHQVASEGLSVAKMAIQTAARLLRRGAALQIPEGDAGTGPRRSTIEAPAEVRRLEAAIAPGPDDSASGTGMPDPPTSHDA